MLFRSGRMPAVIYGEGSTSSAPAPDKPVSSTEVPTLTIDPLRPTEKPGLIEPAFDDEWKQYSAFWTEIEQLRVQAMASALASIEAALDGWNVDYETGAYALTAELSVEQVRGLAALSTVESIYEEYAFDITDDSIRSTTLEAKTYAPTIAVGAVDGTAGGNRMPVIAGITVLFVGAVVFLQRRFV